MKKSGGKAVRYNKWGYIFLVPFIVVYVIFQLIPLFSTIYNSFFENYMSGLTQVGPNFVGLQNYIKLFEGGDIWIYAKNTMILWIMCFVPQIFLSLLLGAWFSDVRLKLKGSRFFKTVIYLPNLIMASAFSMLFFTLFAESGPINSLLIQMGFITEPYKFLSNVGSTRGLIAFMNCLMWFGNTTILLMAGMMGIDTSLFEAAEVDGATSTQVFFRITLPLLRPILVYVLITSLIGGLQLFDVPQILTNGTGNPVRSTTVSYTHLEYFNAEGRGMYAYLTGAASWYMLTIITEVFGVKGSFGDLVIEPKLVKEQFDDDGNAGVHLEFAGNTFVIRYHNAEKKDYGAYQISEVAAMPELDIRMEGKKAVISKTSIEKSNGGCYTVNVILK